MNHGPLLAMYTIAIIGLGIFIALIFILVMLNAGFIGEIVWEYYYCRYQALAM